MPFLRLDAEVTGRRITITFLHKESAKRYNDYLKNLGGLFYRNRSCEFDESNTVSMDLPPEVTAEPIPKTKDVLLTFDDDEDAMEWERAMILWEKKVNQTENQRSISRSLTVKDLDEKLNETLRLKQHRMAVTVRALLSTLT
jgi:hypothetical protein